MGEERYPGLHESMHSRFSKRLKYKTITDQFWKPDSTAYDPSPWGTFAEKVILGKKTKELDWQMRWSTTQESLCSHTVAQYILGR